MQDRVPRSTDGYDLIVDGTYRTFANSEDAAFKAARELKRCNSESVVKIRMRSNGATREMLEDGRIKGRD